MLILSYTSFGASRGFSELFGASRGFSGLFGFRAALAELFSSSQLNIDSAFLLLKANSVAAVQFQPTPYRFCTVAAHSCFSCCSC